MEGLIFLFVIISLIKGVVNKAKSQSDSAPKSNTTVHDPAGADARAERAARVRAELERRRQAREQAAEAAAQKATVSVRKPAPAPQPAVQEGQSAYHAIASEQPTYMGSLQTVTGEGEDLCDPELGHDLPREIGFENAYEQNAEPAFSLNANAVLQGVIMSEILNRPTQRRWVRR